MKIIESETVFTVLVLLCCLKTYRLLSYRGVTVPLENPQYR